MRLPWGDKGETDIGNDVGKVRDVVVRALIGERVIPSRLRDRPVPEPHRDERRDDRKGDLSEQLFH